MTASPEHTGTGGLWLRLAALALVVAPLGLPVNDLFRYAVLVVAAVVIFVSDVSLRRDAWLGAVAVVLVAVLGQIFLPAPRIEEGHNIFLGGEQGRVLEAGLPAEVYRFMAGRFDAQYPPERRCDPRMSGCWRSQGGPERVFAFSGDGIWQRPAHSRRVTDIDFADPVWLRLGFINDNRYNWYSGASDLQRGHRARGLESVLHPWRLGMPFFVMYRLPEALVGSKLCWNGEVLWEGADERFTLWKHADTACREIEYNDVGRRIFGVSIGLDAPLEMKLQPAMSLQLRQLAEPALALIAVLALLSLLMTWDNRRLSLPLGFVALSLVVVLFNDASFIGGVRPFEGGDDGLFYEGVGRRISQFMLAGDWWRALEGGEKVFYYGGPGLRYFRALERFAFGDSFLGYLSLVLAMPFVVRAMFARFFTPNTALVLTVVFVAVPLGALFGSSFFHYVKWAARGFADPAAAIAFVAGFAVLIGRPPNFSDARFAPAFAAGLLFALALFIRPNLAPGAAVLLGGAGLAALWQAQIGRLAGLCIGFLPVFVMALHNWVFGGVFVLFASNITEPANFPTPPSVYVAALGEIVSFGSAGGANLLRVAKQWAGWLSGPSESRWMIPLHALAVAVLIRVAFRDGFGPWLRLTAGAALALHSVVLFYPPTDRYHYLTWLLTLLVTAVWVRDEGVALAQRWAPVPTNRLLAHRFVAWLGRV